MLPSNFSKRPFHRDTPRNVEEWQKKLWVSCSESQSLYCISNYVSVIYIYMHMLINGVIIP